MKPFLNFVRNQEKHFLGEGRFKKYYSVYDAFYRFVYGAPELTAQGPHVRDNLNIKRMMMIVFAALIPCLLHGIYNTGLQARIQADFSTGFFDVILTGIKMVLPIIVTAYLVGGFWEIFFAVVRKKSLNEGFIVTAILFSLTLPPTIPLWQVALGISFGVVFAKEIFGGTGRNFLNPALTARAFIYFAFPAQLTGNVWIALMSKNQIVDGFSGATPLAVAAIGKAPDSITHILHSAGYTLSKCFWGFYPGSIGETSTFAILLGAILLIATGVASWRIMAGCLSGLFGMTLLINLFAGTNSAPYLHMGPFWHLMIGGFAFGMVFMATDPVSSPSLPASKWIYGILIGVITVTIRVANPAYPEGTMLAILMMNVVAPLLDHVVMKKLQAKRIPHVL